MFHSLAYASTAVDPLGSEELLQLLSEARERNEAHGITGVLLYEDGHFLQLLEGAEPEVEKIYDLIRNDPRHTDVRTLWVGKGAKRHFADWRMAFVDLADETVEHPAFSSLLNARSSIESDPSGVGALLGVLESNL